MFCLTVMGLWEKLHAKEPHKNHGSCHLLTSPCMNLLQHLLPVTWGDSETKHRGKAEAIWHVGPLAVILGVCA